jgi:uncharacterized protein
MRLATAAGLTDPTDAVVAQMLAGRDPDDGAGREFLAWTEGMLTAAAIGPERVPPGRWLELAFGQGRVFESSAQAQEYMSALVVMYNTILTDLRRQGSGYTPRFLKLAEDGEEVALAILWVEGFLAGMRLHGEAWRGLIESGQGKLSLAPIAAFMTQADGTPILCQPAEEVAEARKEALPWLGSAVFEIDEYWRTVAKRRASAPVDAFRKIGRNDPCPCGSGRKYKKCCLGRG